MLTNERQNLIMNMLRKSGAATVSELARALYVSDATIRRDLSEMQSLGLLRRSHGGAVLLEAADEVSMLVRMTENAQEKAQAARKAARHIPSDFKTVFLDSSSTVLALAQQMNLSDKTVITNSLQTASSLARIRGINLIVLGGVVSARGNSVSGSWTKALISDFRFDLMLSSCAALDTVCSYETSLDQREIKRAAFERSAHHVLLADHTKFDSAGAYRFEDLTAFEMIVFDKLPEERRAALSHLHIVV